MNLHAREVRPMAALGIAAGNRERPNRTRCIHCIPAPRAEWSVVVPSGRFPCPQCPSVLLRLCRLPVTRQFFLGLCLGCYKAGVFFLKLFDTLCNHLELVPQKLDVSVLDVPGPEPAKG